MKLLVHCENSILADEYKANLEAKGILCYIQKEEFSQCTNNFISTNY